MWYPPNLLLLQWSNFKQYFSEINQIGSLYHNSLHIIFCFDCLLLLALFLRFFNHVTSLIFCVCLRFCLFFLLVHLSIVGLSRIDNLCGTSTLSPTTNLNNNHFYAKPLLYQYTTDRTRRYNLNTPTFTLQSPLQHRPIVENITTDTYTNISNSINYGIRRAPTLRRSDSYSPGMVLPSIAKRNVFLEASREYVRRSRKVFSELGLALT